MSAIEKLWLTRVDVHRFRTKTSIECQAQIDEAYANAFPRLDFKGTYTRNIKLPVLFIPPNPMFNNTDQTLQIELGSKNSFDAAVTMSQVIYNQKVNTAIQIAGEYSGYSKKGTGEQGMILH